MMAFGKNMPIVSNLVLGGKRSKTHGMQDVSFWFNFFQETRKDRLKEAEILAKNLQIPFGVPLGLMDHFHNWDVAQCKRYADYKKTFSGNPSARYAEAKELAENYLKTIGTTQLFTFMRNG